MSIRRGPQVVGIAGLIAVLWLGLVAPAVAQQLPPSGRTLLTFAAPDPDLLPTFRARFQLIGSGKSRLLRTGRVIFELVWRFGTQRPRMLPPWLLLGESPWHRPDDDFGAVPWPSVDPSPYLLDTLEIPS